MILVICLVLLFSINQNHQESVSSVAYNLGFDSLALIKITKSPYHNHFLEFTHDCLALIKITKSPYLTLLIKHGVMV